MLDANIPTCLVFTQVRCPPLLPLLLFLPLPPPPSLLCRRSLRRAARSLRHLLLKLFPLDDTIYL